MTKKFMLTADIDDQDIHQDKTKYTTSITGNDIYFYSDVNQESSLIFNKTITDLSKHLLINQITFDLPSPPVLKLYINSDGGEIFGALSIVDRIRRNKVPVHSYVEGIAASAATIISVSCHKRYISKNSVMLIHQLRGWMEGTHENFKDEHYNLEILSKIIKSIYLTYTKFNENDLDELLKRDIYLNADEAVKYGLCDEII